MDEKKRDKQEAGGRISSPGNQAKPEPISTVNQPYGVPSSPAGAKEPRRNSGKNGSGAGPIAPRGQSFVTSIVSWLSAAFRRKEITQGKVVPLAAPIPAQEEEINATEQNWLERMNDSRRLLLMEEELRKEVIGQDEAVEVLSKVVRRWKAGMTDPNRPIGSILLLGPTGVGKTHLVRALGRFVYGNEYSLVEFDLAGLWERLTTNLSSPPMGNIGYQFPTAVVNKLENSPFLIIVFDKIEGAPQAAHNMLHQIIEKGFLEDTLGNVLDFRNTLILMTTNVGSELIKREPVLGFQLPQDIEEMRAYSEMRKKLLDSIFRVFRKEFINRLDNIVVFRALNREDIRRIVWLELDKVSERLARLDIALEATPAALDRLAEEGYDPEVGAPPLQRVIQLKVEDRLTDAILGEQFQAGDTVLIDVDPEVDDIILHREEIDPEGEPPLGSL